MAIRRCLNSSFRLFFTWRRVIAVQAVLIASVVAASTLMPETRVTLQQALTAFRRLKQRTTEAIRSNSRMAWRCSGNTNEELVRNLESECLWKSYILLSRMPWFLIFAEIRYRVYLARRWGNSVDVHRSELYLNLIVAQLFHYFFSSKFYFNFNFVLLTEVAPLDLTQSSVPSTFGLRSPPLAPIPHQFPTKPLRKWVEKSGDGALSAYRLRLMLGYGNFQQMDGNFSLIGYICGSEG